MAANLTTVAISTRKVIRYGVLFVVIMIVARIFLGIGSNIYNSVVPSPTPKPTVRFGLLPAIPFPQQTQELPTLNINIETATGNLPKFPTQTKVYYMPPYATNLFSFDTAKNKATSLGFTENPLQLSETNYRFSSSDTPSTLELNIVTGAFSISYNLAANSTSITKLPPTPENAITIAKQILSTANSLPTDISKGESSYEFLRVEGNNLVQALSLSDANFIRVSLFRQKYNDLPAVTADPNKATIWFILSGSGDNRGKGVIAGQYRYFPIDDKKVETYPIKSASDALNELKSGGGYIANLGLNKDGNITIRDVSLAYYDSDTFEQFYQPVYVFKGDRNFVAYVPAVSSEYYGK